MFEGQKEKAMANKDYESERKKVSDKVEKEWSDAEFDRKIEKELNPNKEAANKAKA